MQYIAITAVPDLNDPETIKAAKDILKTYIASGVVIRGDFNDSCWVTTNQTQDVTLSFDIDPFSYELNYEDLFQMSLSEFCVRLKAYVVHVLGSLNLVSIQLFLHDVKKLIKAPYAEIQDIEFYSSVAVGQIINFFSALNIVSDTYDGLCNFLDDTHSNLLANTKSSQRNLATFRSYFLFNDILSDYWSHSNPTERRFYFPLYLWWRLTSVIPMRPKEFSLTPRNCLKKNDDGSYQMTLRKTKLKGGQSTITYTINDDYLTINVVIPEALAHDIEWYIAATEKDAPTSLMTLFRTDSYYRAYNQSTPYTSKYFTYTNLNTLLSRFYSDIINKRYGYQVVFESPQNADDRVIEYIHLGDTRHLSMINAILSGATPEIVMTLAGHTDTNIGAHYWSNITELVECKTYRKYKQLTGSPNNRMTLSLSQEKLPANANYIQLDQHGRCFSPRFIEKDYTDCARAMSPSGEIGWCEDCEFYRKTGTYTGSANVYKERIEREVHNLQNAVRLYRNAKGATEDITATLTRLRSEALSYENYLIACKEGEHNAKK